MLNPKVRRLDPNVDPKTTRGLIETNEGQMLVMRYADEVTERKFLEEHIEVVNLGPIELTPELMDLWIRIAIKMWQLEREEEKPVKKRSSKRPG